MGVKRRITKSAKNNQVTLNQAFDEFITEKEARNLSAATIRNYKESYAAFHAFNRYDYLEDINAQSFFTWIKAMKDNNLKPASINHYLRDCRAFFYWCMDEERGYLKQFKISTIESQEEQLKFFTDDELMRLLKKPHKDDSFVDWRMWAIVNWVLGTGNRASTICDVMLDDIDYHAKEIALRHTKNKKAQIIPLSPTLEMTIKEYIKLWRRSAPSGYLFPSVAEEQLTTNALRQSFARYAEKRSVKRHNIHGLRHNFARGWIRNEGNMFALQKILGHSSLEMTRKYVKLFTEDIKKDYDKFSPLDTMKRSGKRTQIVKR